MELSDTEIMQLGTPSTLLPALLLIIDVEVTLIDRMAFRKEASKMGYHFVL